MSSNKFKQVEIGEQNASMFDNLAKTRPHCSSNNCQSSPVTADFRNPSYSMVCNETTSNDLCCTISEQELHPRILKAKLCKRTNIKYQCFSMAVLFLFMLIALTSFIMALVTMLRKDGPNCVSTAESLRQPSSKEREEVLFKKELHKLKENIDLCNIKVNNLTREIQAMKNKPLTSNQSSQCTTCPPGSAGPQGKQGPRGPPGYNGTVVKTTQNDHSMALNSSLQCQYEFVFSTTYTSDHSTDTTCSIRADKHKGFQITGVTCSSKFAEENYLFQTVDPASNITIYHCRCLGSSQHTNPGNLQSVKCYLHYWMCRMAI